MKGNCFMDTQKSLLQKHLKDGIARAKKIIENTKDLKLHVGCGTVYKDGWINIDNNSDNNIEKLNLIWDVTFPLPFSTNSVSFLYNEHLLEHLEVKNAQRVLKDFLRVLKPGGVMRIAMPDLNSCVNTYNNKDYLKNSQESLMRNGLGHVKTNAELLNINMRYWGHQWLYDWEELERRLRDAGCEQIVQCSFGESEHVELVNIESRSESILIAEVTKNM